MLYATLKVPPKDSQDCNVHKDSNADYIIRLLIATFSGTKSVTQTQKKCYECSRKRRRASDIFLKFLMISWRKQNRSNHKVSTTETKGSEVILSMELETRFSDEN